MLQTLKISRNLQIATLGIVFGVTLSLASTSYLRLVVELGHRIGSRISYNNLIADYTTAIIWAALLAISIFFWPVRNEDKYHLFWAWLFKCLMALFFLLFYESRFPSDTEGYYGDILSSKLFDLFEYENLAFGVSILPAAWGGSSGTGNISLLIWHYNHTVPEALAYSYHSLKLTFTMIGLVALYIFYRASIIFTRNENIKSFYVLILFPSLFIWTSRIGKESLILLGISIYIYGVMAWHRNKRFRNILIAVLGLVIAALIRQWMVGVLLFPLFFYFLWMGKFNFSKIFFLLFSAFLILASYQFTLKNNPFLHKSNIYTSIQWVAENQSKGGSAIEFDEEFNDIGDLIRYYPIGGFKALFRPLPFDVAGPIGFLSGLEGLLLLFLFFRALIRVQINDLKNPIVISAIVLILVWAFIYGVTTFNYGTLVRWKTQILPIFLFLLLYLGRRPSGIHNYLGSQYSIFFKSRN